MSEGITIEDRIVAKALDLYLKYGIKSVTMGDLSRELGISKKTLYLYFENKEDLVKKVVDYQHDAEYTKIRKIRKASKNAVEELFRISRLNADLLRRMSPSTMYDLKKYYNEIWQERQSYKWNILYDSISKNLKWGIEEGLYRDDLNINITVVHITYIMGTLVDERLVNTFGYSRLEIFEETFNYHIHGIASTKGLEIWKKYKEENAERA